MSSIEWRGSECQNPSRLGPERNCEVVESLPQLDSCNNATNWECRCVRSRWNEASSPIGPRIGVHFEFDRISPGKQRSAAADVQKPWFALRDLIAEAMLGKAELGALSREATGARVFRDCHCVGSSRREPSPSPVLQHDHPTGQPKTGVRTGVKPKMQNSPAKLST